MIIVTGGAGFIGSALIWKLNQIGMRDILVVDNLASTEKWKNLLNRKFYSYMHKNAFIESIKEKRLNLPVSAVFHLGACSSTMENNADYLLANNTEYSKLLCRFALDKGAKFINASSAATYGDGSAGFSDSIDNIGKLKPLNLYGYSKHLFDLWLLEEKLQDEIASLKFFNVYGPNEYHKGEMRSVVCKAYYEILRTDKMKLFKSYKKDFVDGGQKRDFIYIKNCVEIIYKIYAHNITGIRNVGTGEAITWNQLVNAIFIAMNREVNIEYIDMPDDLKNKYQYYTCADMGWITNKDLNIKFNLTENVKDYINNYLSKKDPYLEMNIY